MPLTPLLFLSPRVPWPLNNGAKIRTHALLTALLARYEVHYVGFRQPELPDAEARAQLAGCAAVTLAPEPATGAPGKALLAARTLASARPVTIDKYWDGRLAQAAAAWQREHARRGAVLHADHLHMAPYLFAGAGGADGALRVMDEHNVESQIVERTAERYTGRALAPYLRLQARRMRAFEAAMAAQADLTLAVSAGDAAELGRMAPGRRFEVIPNGVDLDYFQDPTAGATRRPGRLVFTGSMNWLPNEDAVIWFVREILPELERQSGAGYGAAGYGAAGHGAAGHGAAPAWTLDIVGQAPPPPVTALASAQVRVTGTVPDVRPYVQEAQLYIVPLRIGGGSRLKILEAFAMGIPVVSTTIGCEGLEVEDGRELLIADTPAAFAAALVRLTADPAFGAELAARARTHVREHFSWPSIGRRLIELYDTLAAPSPARQPD